MNGKLIERDKFFYNLNFEKCEFEYPTGKEICYKGSDGGYYIDELKKRGDYDE